MSENIRKKIIVGLIAGGAVVAGTAIYCLYLRENRQPVAPIDLAPQSKSIENRLFSKDAKYHELVNQLKLSMEVDNLAKKLSKPTLIEIHKIGLHLLKHAYLQLCQEGRVKRKAKIDDIVSYAEEYFRCARTTEDLIKEATEQALHDLNIEKEFYMREYERVVHEDPNFQLFKLYLFESLKVQLWNGRGTKLTKSNVVDFYNYQLSLVGEFDSSALKDYALDKVLLCKQSYLNDKAGLKFNIDEEDIMLDPVLLNDPEIRDLQQRLHLQLTLGNSNTISFPY